MNVNDTYAEINRTVENIKYQNHEDRMRSCSLIVTLLNCLGNQGNKAIPNFGDYRINILNNIELICNERTKIS